MPPLNAFEEAISLTEAGVLWHFPIDNEARITNEDYNMPFYEHVLLDHYLDEFPQVELIQNFMRLVITGLSKNAFMTAKEKQETIYWYKNYFNDKIEVIYESLKLEQLENEQLRGSIVNE
jgi:small subunit ribosomal protein S31